MASISLTLLDTNHGIIVSTFQIDDKDINRVYSHYLGAMKEAASLNSSDPDFEPNDLPNITSNDICDHIAKKCMNMIIGDIYNQEAKVCVQKNIFPIAMSNVKSNGS